MPYGAIKPYRIGRRVVIEIELPEQGEPSNSGYAENLVDPRRWVDLDEENDHLGIKMALVRPYRASLRKPGLKAIRSHRRQSPWVEHRGLWREGLERREGSGVHVVSADGGARNSATADDMALTGTIRSVCSVSDGSVIV